MPYVAIPTFTDGSILSASALNTLSANVAFLYGVANRVNFPFCSYTATKVDSTVAQWYIPHTDRYYHWQVKSDSPFDYARIYYNGVKVAEVTSGNFWQGTFDLTSWAGVPNNRGAWASGTSYDNDHNGDGDVVTQSGSYYRCKLAHTSAAGNQPGIGASWATYWDVLTLPAIGSMCRVWANLSNSATIAKSVDYLLETDSVSFPT
jgi:hypothetical protein